MTGLDVEVREERISDTEAISAVHEASFPTAAEAKLVDALRDTDKLKISLVACDLDAVVGHVAFSPVTVADAATGLGLGPVAVLPQYRCKGIADRLIRAGLDRCRELEYGFVVVLGDPAYYRRFGFEVASTWGLADEFGGGDAFQAIELSADSVPEGGGTVCYCGEFSAVADEG